MSNPGKKTTDDDEVEQLLRAAQDDVLLKLNVDSHMARGSASAAIDPDLDRRFQALKKKPQRPTKLDDSTKRPPTKVDTGDSKVDGAPAEDDDLFARFAALKNSLPSYNKNESKSNFPADEQATEEESEDEVDKVIKWAIDAARLDPSPSSDDDDRSESDDDDDGVENGKKGKKK
ncbi:hypothetical protein Salat_1913000 [Sesamum alatum]|uniref:Uncharacterized protein n=1 Tax=Sesamum alatum TaxID=300844 RepID=A0AAE2CIE9_9LAMI|nr:hypothetical protein Salat_1913000 [Sesamum alatum]